MNKSETNETLVVDGAELSVLNTQPGLGKYLSSVVSRRGFIRANAKARAFRSAEQMFLGKLWLILQPLLDSLLYALIFGLILKTNRGIENFVGYLTIGVVFFSFFQRQFLGGNLLLRSNKALLQSFQMPSAAIVLSTAYRNFLDAILPALVALVIAVSFGGNQALSSTILLVPLLFILLEVFGAGSMLVTARATASLPDLKHIFELLGRGLFFFSGIFYSIDRFVEHDTIRNLMLWNPVYQYLASIRDVAIYETVPPLEQWMYMFASSCLMFSIGFIFYWSGEKNYAKIQ